MAPGREADVRTGGAYRFVFGHPSSEQPMEFFGTYIEVTPPCRLVWTNALYPSKEALDGAIASGATGGFGESFEQLDELFVCSTTV